MNSASRRSRFPLAAALLALCAVAFAPLPPAHAAGAATGVVGVDTAQLDADYWIARLPQANKVVLDRGAIAAQNRKLQQSDPSLYNIDALPTTLDGKQVGGWIRKLSARPSRTLYDTAGKEIARKTVDDWLDRLNLQAIPESQPTRYGLIVHRADLRTFPTTQRVFSARGDTDIDRFQETAFFPGTPVAIAHESRDGKWWFVVGTFYAAWVEKQAVAEGSKTQVFSYVRKVPYLVVTGATVRTTYTPNLPQVSDLQLDMGIRLPLLKEWPGNQSVNGQAAYASYVIELPVRNDDGSLRFAPALLPRTADVSPDYLPLTQANLLRQSFKFLGERYGWGNDYGTRDCSSFVSEVYRSLGVQLPRNTSDQGVSPALNRLAFKPGERGKRTAAVKQLQVGDLVYIPGHVMMVIGNDNGMPYVIHDTNGGAWLDTAGKLVRGDLNGVSVTPLPPMRASLKQTYVDRMTNIQRIRP
ncbi:SH3 domain-containing protein [Luteimonas aquatica]|uniref:C40 family peptidase n=1 Tax=Luteimonas aquatica TaxID=450364 RepID=UPI001F59B6F1|nr:SH3 domain-containing protein [Luteimonas aquatica]